MPFTHFRIIYPRSDFRSLVGPVPLPLLTETLIALPLSSPILDIRAVPRDGVSVEWESSVSDEDQARVLGTISQFAGTPTTSEPIAVRRAESVSAPQQTPVTVLEVTTPPRDAGTYLVSWLSQFRLTAAASATLAQALVTVNDFAQPDVASGVHPHAFNGSATFEVALGQAIRARLSIAKLGPGPVSAEMTDAHLFITRVR